MRLDLSKFDRSIGLAAGDFRYELGVAAKGALWERVATDSPNAITAASRRFIEAGADILIAFTDRLNSIASRSIEKTSADVAPIDLARLNRTIVKSMAAAAQTQPDAVVLAALGPVEPLLMLNEITPDELVSAYAEQARECAGAGVGGFICRSFSELDALGCAVRAIQSVCDLPVIGSMAFDAGPDAIETTTGASVAQAHTMLAGLGAAMTGVDRSEFPDGAAAVVSLIRQSGKLPIYVEVNAGRAELVEQRIVYPEPADVFGERLERLAAAGANIVAGGLGAGVDHIAQLARMRTRLQRRAAKSGGSTLAGE